MVCVHVFLSARTSSVWVILVSELKHFAHYTKDSGSARRRTGTPCPRTAQKIGKFRRGCDPHEPIAK
jgi:hypothetical protein